MICGKFDDFPLPTSNKTQLSNLANMLSWIVRLLQVKPTMCLFPSVEIIFNTLIYEGIIK